MPTASAFAALHDRRKPLLLPNAWDAASARIFEEAGFPAAATSSAAVAWSLGAADGGGVDVDDAIAAIGRIARAIRIPLSADIEDGWHDDVAGLLDTVERVREAGAIGINIEDWSETLGDLRPMDVAVERIAAIKARFGDSMFVNARTDTYLRDIGDSDRRLETTLERLRAFVGAGADGVFVPGVADEATIAALAASTPAPLNVLADGALPPLARLGQLGVARVSLGSGPALVSLGAMRRLAHELAEPETFAYLRAGGVVSFAEANALFAAR